ncbi:hypothetical protein E4U21_003002 [Claviceps maximensis]|nr:hypothetical protein E4U21_003002 [Claviceps maximensis]
MSLYGRWYTPLGPRKYPWPIDDLASKNMDIMNKFFLQKRGKYFCAPLQENTGRIRRVLDLGTGSGVWACQIAEGDSETLKNQYGVRLYGSKSIWSIYDSSTAAFTPTSGMTYTAMLFSKATHSCKLNKSSLRLTCSRHLRPGHGFIEHVEIDWVPRWCEDIPENSAIQRWSQYFRDGVANLGRSVEVDGPRVRATLVGAGFVRLKEETSRCFLSPQLSRDKRQSEQWLNSAMRKSIADWSLAPLINGLGFTPAQVYSLCEQVDFELSHCRSSVHFTL